MQDYYAVLGVTKDADPEVIKAAYRALAKKHHPDTSGGSAERFLQISRAWEVLSSPDLRRAYDKTADTRTAHKPGPEVKPSPEVKPLPEVKVFVPLVAVVVSGAGVVGLLLLVLTATKLVTGFEAITPPSQVGPSAQQLMQNNGLTKATNDWLREVAKCPAETRC